MRDYRYRCKEASGFNSMPFWDAAEACKMFAGEDANFKPEDLEIWHETDWRPAVVTHVKFGGLLE